MASSNISISATAQALRRRYLYLLITCTVIFALLIIGYGWSLRVQQQSIVLTDALAKATQRKSQLTQQLEHVRAHVLRMHSTVSNYFAFDILRDRPNQPALVLHASSSSDTSPWDRLPQELRAQIGSLHRLSKTIPIDETELGAVLATMPETVATHARRKELAWSYYYDADQQWFVIYPPLTAGELLRSTRAKAIDEALSKTFAADGTDPVGLARSGDGTDNMLRWTPPYLDAAGKGNMISVLAPVFAKTSYQGVVGADITLNNLSGFIAAIQSPLLRSVLIDQQNRVLADSQQIGNQTSSNDWLSSLLANQALPATTATSPGMHQFAALDGGRVLVETIEQTPLRLVSYIPNDNLERVLWNVFSPYGWIALIAGFVLLGLGLLLHRMIIAPALMLVCYIEALDANCDSPLPGTPTFWTKWFVQAADTARQRVEYRQRLLANSRELEKRVERRTEELEYANRALRVALRRNSQAPLSVGAAGQQSVRPQSNPRAVSSTDDHTDLPLGSLDAPITRAIDNIAKLNTSIVQISTSASAPSNQMMASMQPVLDLINNDLATALALNHNFGRLVLDSSDTLSRRFSLRQIADEVAIAVSYRFSPIPISLSLNIPDSIEVIGHAHHLQQALDIAIHAAALHGIDHYGAGNIDISAQSNNIQVIMTLAIAKSASSKTPINTDMFAITAAAVAHLLGGSCHIDDNTETLSAQLCFAADMRQLQTKI